MQFLSRCHLLGISKLQLKVQYYYVTDELDDLSTKQENGILYQYELPIEQDSDGQWTRTLVKTPSSSVVTKALGPRKRGRPRKYPNEQGQIGK